MTLNTSSFGLVYHVCTSTPLCQSSQHMKFEVPSFIDSKDIIKANI